MKKGRMEPRGRLIAHTMHDSKQATPLLQDYSDNKGLDSGVSAKETDVLLLACSLRVSAIAMAIRDRGLQAYKQQAKQH